MKHKKLIVTAIALFSVVVFFGVFFILWFWGDNYPDFNKNEFHQVELQSGDSLEIPGLDEGAVPQGIGNYTYVGVENDYLTKQEYLFISAYMKEGPSRIYVTGTRTGYVGYVTLKNQDGTDYTGHAGGIATSCNNSNSDGNKTRVQYGTLWVVSDGTVYCAKRSADEYYNIAEEVITKAALTMQEGEQSIQFTSSFNANNGASFCFFYEDGTTSVNNDRLYVGEFYREGDDRYSTAETHHITTKSGEKQYAFVYEYQSNTSSTNEYGLEYLKDTYAYDADGKLVEKNVPAIKQIISIPAKIQGLARTSNNQLVLSESYGLPNSHLYYYDWSKLIATSNRTYYRTVMSDTFGEVKSFEYEGVYTSNGAQYALNGKGGRSDIYVYSADESCLVRDYSIPAMAEGMCVNGDRVYLLFESGCYKYKMFVRQRITDIVYFTPREN